MQILNPYDRRDRYRISPREKGMPHAQGSKLDRHFEIQKISSAKEIQKKKQKPGNDPSSFSSPKGPEIQGKNSNEKTRAQFRRSRMKPVPIRRTLEKPELKNEMAGMKRDSIRLSPLTSERNDSFAQNQSRSRQARDRRDRPKGRRNSRKLSVSEQRRDVADVSAAAAREIQNSIPARLLHLSTRRSSPGRLRRPLLSSFLLSFVALSLLPLPVEDQNPTPLQITPLA